MSRYDFYGTWPTTPIETDAGIRARSKRGGFASNWWAKRWIEALEQLVDAGRLTRGRSYARRGQVLSLEFAAGAIQARVQGSRPMPYQVSIRLRALTDAQWEAVADAMARQALFLSQLLAGEMPTEIERVFAAVGVSLLPEQAGDLETACTCPDWSNPCKHTAAAHYLLAEQLDEEPFLLFQLRGRTQAQLLAALRQRRGSATDEEWEAPPDPVEESAPLESEISRFWELGPLDGLRVAIQPPRTRWPILQRLGQPAFLDEAVEHVLGPALDAISQAAVQAAYGEDTD